MPLPREFLDELILRNNIVEVVGSYVQLKRRGSRYVALCPFHNEKTPSFTVYPDSNSYYCFGCGAGGDVITFIRQEENLDYVEAVRLLANRSGMTMPEESDKEAVSRRSRIFQANREAARFFFESLNSEEGRDARGYLRGRKLSDQTITRFGIGYAPDSWDALLTWMKSKGFSEEELITAGLCLRSKKGNCFDFFRKRVMFPVFDLQGHVVAFSGRRLKDEDDSRKYVNTGDTPVFKKSRVLFGMNFAKNSGTRQIILAEGQMDAIALHQAGFDNAVAALGTALTDEHARMISGYADEVVIAYDSDEAGRRATNRAIEIIRTTNLTVKVLTLTGAKDADEFIKKFGRERFEALLHGSDDSVEYELKRAASNYDITSDGGKVRFLRDAAAILAKCVSPTECDVYASRVARDAGVSKSAVLEQVASIRGRRRKNARRDENRQLMDVPKQYNLTAGQRDRLGEISAQRRLAACLFTNPDLCGRITEKLGDTAFPDGELKEAFECMKKQIERGIFGGFSTLSQELGAQQIAALAGVVAAADGVNFSEADVDLLTGRIRAAAELPTKEQLKEMDPDLIRQMIQSRKNEE